MTEKRVRKPQPKKVSEMAVAVYSPTIKDLPPGERPRERLLAAGAENLSNAELLAIILRTGTQKEMVTEMAGKLLAKYGGLWGLHRATAEDLRDYHGLGEAKICQLKAALELGRRILAEHPEERLQIRGPHDVASLLQIQMAALEQESLRVILLDNKNRVVAVQEVYKGNVGSSVVRMAELFRDAVQRTCPSIIIVHNHPSGDPTPSSDDVRVTEQAILAGKQLDIEVLDHIVIGRGRCVSLKEQGLAFR